MSFSAVTCLSYTGTTPLGGVMNIYSDYDGFTTPIQSSINLSAITGNECPYYIEVPNGTTQIRILDISTGCYCDTFVQSNDLCVSCELDFSSYSASTVGRIVAGNLTGACESNITDYRIFWYETGDTTNPVYVSGKGTEFTPYSFTHPLTGTSSIFAQAGTYIPIIDKIKLSGLTFSQTGGTGNIPAELECFDLTRVTVDAFTCGNGDSSDSPYYEHRVNFLSASVGSTPQALEATFLFTGVTDYFAWKFKGFAVEDRLRLTYIGSAYSEELLIEDITVGSNLISSDFSLNKFPKSADTVASSIYLKKVTCLTGLTRNIGDSLRIEVIPNQFNNETNWDFYFTCLNGFSQDTCILNNFPYKISASTITTVTGGCNTNTISFSVSACGRNVDDFSTYIATDNGIILANNVPYYESNIYGSGSNNLISNAYSLYFNAITAGATNPYFTIPDVCDITSTGTITFKKYVSGGTIGIIDIQFTDFTDFNAYYNSYLKAITGTTTTTGICATSSGPWSGTPSDPTDIRYYRYFYLSVPSTTGNSICGSDGSTVKQYLLHTGSVVTTGITGSDYTLRFTMPTVYDGLTYDPNCTIKGNILSVVNDINARSTGTTNNYTGTTTVSSRYTNPVSYIYAMCSGSTSATDGTSTGFLYVPKYINETIVYSGTSPTLVNSLSGKTFNFDTSGFTYQASSNNLSYYGRYNYYYTVKLNNPSDRRDFEIYTRSLTGITTSSEFLIYSYTGATSAYTIHNSSYFI